MTNNIIQVLVFVALAFAAIDCVAPRNKFEEGLLKLIEKCRNGDVKSLPIPFPSLKPLKIPPVKFDYDGYSMSLSELKVKGLEDLSVEMLSADAADMTISMKMSIPMLAVRADRYHLQGTALFFISIDDKGILKSNVNNLRVHASIKFGAKGKDTVVTHLKLDYSVGDIQVQLSGSNGIVNDVVNDKVSSMIDSSEMRGRLQHLIMDLISDFLRGHTPQELIEMISNMLN